MIFNILTFLTSPPQSSRQISSVCRVPVRSACTQFHLLKSATCWTMRIYSTLCGWSSTLRTTPSRTGRTLPAAGAWATTSWWCSSSGHTAPPPTVQLRSSCSATARNRWRSSPSSASFTNVSMYCGSFSSGWKMTGPHVGNEYISKTDIKKRDMRVACGRHRSGPLVLDSAVFTFWIFWPFCSCMMVPDFILFFESV